jgi:asparagine synthase (glutamine-hydrolysing)
MAARIPASFKTAGAELKPLLKMLLGRYVPRQLWARPKRGFGVPLVPWLRGRLREWAHDQLNGRDSHLPDWLDHRALQAMLNDHLSGRCDVARLIWACLQLAGWDLRVTQFRWDCLLQTVESPSNIDVNQFVFPDPDERPG